MRRFLMAVTIPLVRDLDTRALPDEYDLFIATVGYEDRATFISKNLSIRAAERIAVGFTEKHVFNYEANRDWYVREKYTVDEPGEADFGSLIRSKIQRLGFSSERLRLCVDISSMTRTRLAVLVDTFRQMSLPPIDAYFLYAVAAYSPAPKVTFVNRHVGPVLPSFAGWWIHPERPTVAVVGLGYEQNKALGAVEHIQVGEVLLFIPASSERQYSEALELANRTLLKEVRPSGRFYYVVDKPLDCFSDLELLVSSLLHDSNPILLPFGPKIFTLTSLLVAAVHPTAAVWRVSGAEEPTDRVAAGEVTGISACFDNPRRLEDSPDALAETALP
jgi:hypothetical protein